MGRLGADWGKTNMVIHSRQDSDMADSQENIIREDTPTNRRSPTGMVKTNSVSVTFDTAERFAAKAIIRKQESGWKA